MEKNPLRVILLLEGGKEVLLEMMHETAEWTSKLLDAQLICAQYSAEIYFNPSFCCSDGWLETEEN